VNVAMPVLDESAVMVLLVVDVGLALRSRTVASLSFVPLVLGGEVRRISARSAARAWRLREAGEEVIITGRSQIRKPGRGIQSARTARRP
jgi:hypothetical protein